MRFMYCLTAFLTAILFQSALASDSSPEKEAREIFGMFEAICLEQLRNQETIPKFLENIGAKELPLDEAAKFLTPHTGRGWITPSKKGINSFMILLSDTKACSVFAPRAKSAPVLELFKTHTRNRLINEEKIGSQMEYTFAISHNDQFIEGDAHALVLISTSMLFGGKSIFMNAIPESELSKAGISTLAWPK